MEETPQNKYLVPLAIIVAGGLVAGAIYFGTSTPSTYVPDQSNNQTIEIAPVTEKDHILGSRDAELVIVEYSDTECPWCKIFHETMKEVMSTYGDRVAWVYRHVPYHSLAPKEAEATECANELGGDSAFWKYVDKIFETTLSNDGLSPDELPKIAQEIGLDVTTFNQCLSSGRYAEIVKENIQDWINLKRGTPYSVILTQDGKQTVINGAEPIENVKVKIDALLK
ncbi:MAG: thioredoxin domain-containing protein [bacterium]|nr:thioredoxin domain-containing protein [bacterium]